MLFQDRRRHPRFKCTGPADAQLASDVPASAARVVNVSKGGCLIEFQKSQMLAPDAAVELAFNVNRLPFRVQVRAAGIRTETLVGFQFSSLSGRVQGQLDELLEELAADWRKQIASHFRNSERP